MIKKCSIGIMDDQLIVASSLVSLVSTFDFVERVDLLQAPHTEKYKSPRTLYSLLIIDINMPFYNGFEVSRMIKEKRPEQKIVLLSSRTDVLSIDKAKSLHIEGYLFKSINADELRRALMHIVSGNTYYQEVSKPEQRYYSFQDGTRVQLTKREIDFLEYLLQELSTKEIAHVLGVSDHTVIGYRRRLFRKFNVQNMVGLAKYALEILG